MMDLSSNASSRVSAVGTNKKRLFDFYIEDLDCNIIYTKIYNAIKSKQKLVINYVNTNTIRLTRKNNDIKEALKNADIIHSDGVGFWLGSKLFNDAKLKYRFNFTDCSLKILRDIQSNGWSIFLLGSTDNILKMAVNKLKQDIPGVKIVGVCNGYDDIKTKDIVSIINEKTPDILWVGMGTPTQELWIYENKNKLNCTVIQSVGDLITYMAGRKTRGPVIIQKIGFEWLIRFLRHPIKYFGRYIIGIPVFFFMLMKEYFVNNNK